MIRTQRSVGQIETPTRVGTAVTASRQTRVSVAGIALSGLRVRRGVEEAGDGSESGSLVIFAHRSIISRWTESTSAMSASILRVATGNCDLSKQ